MIATRPDKAAVRAYLAERRAAPRPPDDPARIRELLGWAMIEGERKANERRSK